MSDAPENLILEYLKPLLAGQERIERKLNEHMQRLERLEANLCCTKPHYTLDELLAQSDMAGTHPLSPEEREWIDAPPVGKELL